MPRYTIQESQRGLLYKDGKLTRFLEPGRHDVGGFFSAAEYQLTLLDLASGYADYTPELKRVLPKGTAEDVTIGRNEMGILLIDGLSMRSLPAGRYLLWKQWRDVTLERFDFSGYKTDMPQAYWSLLSADVLQVHTVQPYQRRPLYIDGQLVEILEAGRYGIIYKNHHVTYETIDLREQELSIVGQEVMTRDNVSLRINLMLKYKIVDVEKSVHAVQDLHNALYNEFQVTARHFVSALTIDDLLGSRKEASTQMKEKLTERAAEWGVEIVQANLKDLVLPGDMKTLLNRVIEAEKEAQANLILRREETAATRSLANTAKMLEKNPMLLRLKEMEQLKELAGHIGQLTIVASSQDLMGKLLASTIESDKHDV